MSQKQPTPSDESIRDAVNQVPRSTPPAVVRAIATHMDRAKDAAARIEEEGSVVRDMKGSVIAHPAIKIEIDAIKWITDLINKARNY